MYARKESGELSSSDFFVQLLRNHKHSYGTVKENFLKFLKFLCECENEKQQI